MVDLDLGQGLVRSSKQKSNSGLTEITDKGNGQKLVTSLRNYQTVTDPEVGPEGAGAHTPPPFLTTRKFSVYYHNGVLIEVSCNMAA
jgi:hypothetical protein